jgi:pantetheine-phosphate adenylyltransferase
MFNNSQTIPGLMNVCLGGTFDPFHKGHEALLRKAFEAAGPLGTVYIGITSDVLTKRKGEVHSFIERKQSVERFLQKEGWKERSRIRLLTDKYGPTIGGDFDAIVVTEETKPTADEINVQRQQIGKKPLQVIVIPFVLAGDSQPISSSRIRRGEIDVQGTVLG